MNRIPLGNRDSICRLIREFAKKCYYLWRAKYYKTVQCDQYKARLIYFGLLDHKNVNDMSISTRTITRRNNYMRKCVDYLDGCVADTIDLRGDLLNYSWYNNHLSFNQLMPKIELMFIRKQNVMLEQLNNDHDYCVKRAMLGIVNRLSQSTWRAFNKTVKNIF